ncbi:MAG: cell division FtsA domain-containing protein [Bacilli bacterium]|nr:cell division FtsA domain-containing protein [Bacilli bacterium]
MRKIMSSLDIGYASIKLIVAEINKKKLYVLTSSIVNNDALKKDMTIDYDILEGIIKKLLSDAKEKLGIEIKKTLLTIPTDSASFTINRARIDIKNEDNLITVDDMIKVVNLSGKNVVQDNMELVNITPLYYTLDDSSKTDIPVNTFSRSLEVKSIITSSSKDDVYKYLRVLDNLGVSVVDISYDVVGNYFAFKSDDMDTTCGIIIDIGYLSTSISVYNKGVLVNTLKIKVGSLNVLKDISYVYKISLDSAKEVYKKLGLGSSKNANNLEKIELKDNNGDKLIINQVNLSEIIESRVQEILSMAKKQINTLTKRQISYIICTGGIANIGDFDLNVLEIFGKNARIGYINTIGIRDTRYASTFGLIKWYDYNAKLKNYDYSILNLEEQEEFSKEESEAKTSSNSIIGKVFDYFFE